MDVRRRMLVNKKSSSEGSNTVGSYSVNLNGEWEKTTVVPNPDSTLYDGVYRSVSNYNVNNGVSTMYITITDCSSFKMYIRSYAESSWDYVMVSQLDQTITGSTAYNNSTLVKAHTSGNQQSGTALSSYTLVEFTGISSGMHTITVVYRKDGSVNTGDDRGYVLIENLGGGSEDNNEAINIDNYLTIEASENGLTASLSVNACEYCVDGDGNWKTLSAGTATESINSGHILSFRGNLTPTTSSGIGTFTISKKCNLKGNCMSMLFGDNAANNYSLLGKKYGFYRLFYNCSTIVNVSSNFLPATTLESDCYRYMFYGCTSLTTAPKLQATTVKFRCYNSMFEGCTSLTTAPTLPATTLANSCYNSMFKGCTSLTTAPTLPATTLLDSCYYYMFYGCTNLTTAPTLPATTLASSCYHSMFRGCTSLTTAPSLPATTLASYCYYSMFYGCSRLTTAPTLPATTLASYCYYYMFQKCTSLTTAPTLPATTLAISCYRSMFDGCTKLKTAPKLSATTLADSCYYYMFNGCTTLTTPPELPATTLANSCYYGMFNACANLTTAPVLQATTLTESCYQYMFYGCTKLTTTPELPATTLASYCYSNMFYNCASLTTAPTLPATTLAEGCYNSMFFGCANLTTAPTLPATTLVTRCYQQMFYGCTKLKTAPELPGATLIDNCYYRMFYNCNTLNNIKMLATDISASNCLTDWVKSVASTGTFIKHPNMTTLSTGTSGIPSGWTVVNNAEESGGGLITFTIDGTEYQAENGMTFYDWALSEYYDSSCNLYVLAGGNNNLRDDIINELVSPDDSVAIFYGAGVQTIPEIYTNTIIQPIAYTPDFSAFG